MSKKLELKFLNTDSRTVTVSLDDPVEPLDAVAIEQAMDTILAENCFMSTGGDLVGKKGARVVERNVTEIPLS